MMRSWAACLWVLLPAVAAAHEDLELQIARISRQIEAEPERAILYFRRGELYRLHENYKAAREDLERAAARDPELAAADLALGRVLNLSGDPLRARTALDRFLARRPDHAEGLIERARARVSLGERREAVEDYTRALARIEEPRAENYIERADVLRTEGRIKEAMAGLEEGVRKVGPALPLQLLLLDLELETAQYAAALARVEELARKSERQDSWLVRRAEILTLAGRAAEARQSWQSALAAIEALPAGRRKTRYTRDLESKVRVALEAKS